jgi:hypothetical protein
MHQQGETDGTFERRDLVEFFMLSLVLSTLIAWPKTDDRLAWTFLQEAERILRQDRLHAPIREGSLPTLHGRQYFDDRIENERKAAETFDRLGQGYFLAFAVWSDFRDGKPQEFSTMSGHNQLDWAPLNRTNAHFDANRAFYGTWGPEGCAQLFKSEKLKWTQDVDYAGDAARIYFQALRANGQTRKSDHSPIFRNAARGKKPLAVLVLIAVKKPG